MVKFKGFSSKQWHCPIFDKMIAEGNCLEIQYELMGLLNDGNLTEIYSKTENGEPWISATCKSCPNFPPPGGIGEIHYPQKPE